MLTAVPSQLTPDQRRIVEWGDGPLVVIAGAGTGKTKVIVERVRWLLETRGAPAQTDDPLLPEHLLVLTYNVKAAKELQTRRAGDRVRLRTICPCRMTSIGS